MSRSSMDRRRFLQSAAAGALVAAAPAPLPASGADAPAAAKKRPVLTRPLGKTGLTLPVVSMGVMNADNPALVAAALDAGIVHLDTAHYYQKGKNEEMVGRVLKGRPRGSFVVATKALGFMPMPYDTGIFPDDEESRARLVPEFLARVDESLRRLGLDYVDILYLHNVWTREAALHPPLLKALEKVKKEGKAKHIGISTHKNEPIVLQAAIDSKLYEVVLVAYNFKQDHVAQVREGIAKAAAAGLGIVGMKTFAGGWLDREKTKPVDVKAALKWVLEDPNVHTVIPGFTTFEQMEEDLSVMADPVLTDGEREGLRLARAEEGLYCQGCQACLAGCSRRLPLPDLMRAYMYANGYRDPGQARDLAVSLGLAGDPCAGCPACTASCAKGFDLRSRAGDVARLASVPGEFFG